MRLNGHFITAVVVRLTVNGLLLVVTECHLSKVASLQSFLVPEIVVLICVRRSIPLELLLERTPGRCSPVT